MNPLKIAELVNLSHDAHATADPFEAVLRSDTIPADPPEDTPEDIAGYEADEQERDWLDKAIDAYDDAKERRQNADEDWDRGTQTTPKPR